MDSNELVAAGALFELAVSLIVLLVVLDALLDVFGVDLIGLALAAVGL